MTPVLIALWLAWAALLFGGFAFGRPAAPGARRMPTWTRLLSSVALVAAAVVFRANAPDKPALGWVALGMAFGLLGDLFMARLIVRHSSYVYGGIAAFGVGHLAYLAALLDPPALGLAASGPPWGALLAAWAFGLMVWFFVIWRPAAKRGALHLAALVYALLLSATLGAATGAALTAPAFWPAALGALLFLISDLVLAAGLFNGLKFRGLDDVVWLTYGPGQMLIVFGIGLAITAQ